MRAYNNKISERANISLNRRKYVVRLQKICIALGFVIALSVIILFSSSVHAFAGSSKAPAMKYYKNVRVEAGDTIWTISDEYCDEHYSSKNEYVKEVCALNNISKGDIIHVGDYILVAYYSTEEK